MEAENIAVFNGMTDGVGMKLILEEIFRCLHGCLVIINLLCCCVFLKDGRAGEAEELSVREEFFDGLVVLSKLGAVTFIKDEDDTFVAQRLELDLVVLLVGVVQCKTKLLNGSHDHLVRIVLGKQTAHEGSGVGVLLNAAFLKLVEFLAGLAVEILTVNNKEAFVNVRVVLQERRSLKRREGLSAPCGMPNEAVATVLVDTFHNILHRIHLVRSHHEQLLFAGDEHHVPTNGLTQRTLC